MTTKAQRITRDPAFTAYHAWNLIPQQDGTTQLVCACGLDRTFSNSNVAEMALKIHMA